jgi:ribonuclease P protein component
VGGRARGPLSLGRSQRLRAGEFEAIFRQRGHREEAESLVALWRSCSGNGKVGFAIGRKLGGALERNRARRRLREAYRQERGAKQDGFDVVFVGRSALLSRSFADVRGDILRVLRILARKAGSGAGTAAGR